MRRMPVRGVLSLRTVGWDSFNRMVVIRDRATRAYAARAVMEALLLPRGQVSFDVQFLTVDTDRSYHYGASLQTLFQFIDFGNIGGLKSVLPAAVSSTKFLTFGAGATLFGVGVADAMAFATYSNSIAQTIYDATVVVADRETANFHIGDKYPIASSIYTGFGQGQGSIYNPAPQITLEDLGLILKITPHLNGDGDVGMDVEAEYKSLGNQTFNTVPSIAQRSFKGTVNLKEGEWAILAGIDSTANSFTRSGLAGLSQIPGLNQILSETTRDMQTSNTLLVIKPTITRLPMSGDISPQFLLGTRRGERVVDLVGGTPYEWIMAFRFRCFGTITRPRTFMSATQIRERALELQICVSSQANCQEQQNAWYSNGRNYIRTNLWKTGRYANKGHD